MANRRILVKRRKAVRNIRKITRTMQLIATARFQAAFNRATATKPYTEKLAELVSEISSASENIDHPLMRKADKIENAAVVVLTSMRGLCGGYNANVLRTAVHHIDGLVEGGTNVTTHMAGKKGIGYFKFLKREVHQAITDLGDKPAFEQVEPIANSLMDRFTSGEIDAAYVVYMQFISAGKQLPHVMQLLPLSKDEQGGEEGASAPAKKAKVEYEYSPDAESLLAELLPATVRVRLFQCVNDAIVSEQIARMVAMKAATDAAGDMIGSLTRKYNRARQTQITMELLDIVGGANALG